MDKNLLIDIFHIPSRSGEEELMQQFICDYLDNLEIEYNIDDIGNIYNISYEDKPLLNAHMDTVQDLTDSKLQKFAKIRGDILSGYGVIGADDKCGIFIILELLKEMRFNFLFCVQEEVGLMGSSYFEKRNFFSDLPYGITLDRFGNSDIICNYNDYGTKEFEKTLSDIGKAYGYTPDRGVLSDADNISDQISTCNLSVGYYNHHTKGEFVAVSELENALKFVRAILFSVEENFEAPDKRFTYYEHYPNYFIHGYDDEDIGLEIENTSGEDKFKCFVTGEKSHLFYLPQVDKYISKRGAKILFSDIEDCGVFEELYSEDFTLTTLEDADEPTFRELEEIEAEFKNIVNK